MTYLESKKGAASTGRLIGVVVVVLMVAALGATIFGAESGLSNTTFTSAAPAWVVTLLTVGAGIALVRLIIR